MFVLLMTLHGKITRELARATRQNFNPEFIKALENLQEAIWTLKSFY